MTKDLPIFDIILSEDDLSQGVGMISLVDEPAIGVNWIALKKQPNSILAKRKPKSVLAKRECLGCPPNGDGKKANGEPDKRCKQPKGEGGSGKSPKVPDTTKSTPSDVATPQQSINRTTQIGSTMGIIIDDKAIIENAKKAGYTVVEDVFAANKTIKIIPGGTDKATFNIVYNPKGNLGKASGMPYLSIQDPGRGGESFLEAYRKSNSVQEPLKKLFPDQK